MKLNGIFWLIALHWHIFAWRTKFGEIDPQVVADMKKRLLLFSVGIEDKRCQRKERKVTKLSKKMKTDSKNLGLAEFCFSSLVYALDFNNVD